MNTIVRDMPVVVIVILGNRVTVDGEPIYHDGTRPLAEVAAEAAAERFARPLGRPVRAVASDQGGTCTLTVHPNGSWSGVAAVTSSESEHFPESGVPPRAVLGASLPGVAVSHSRATSDLSRFSLRRALVAVLAVVALLVVAATVSGRLSRDEPAAAVAEPPVPAVSSTPTPTPTATPSPAETPSPTRITGIARQQPGGPVRLTIRSSVAPLSVNVVLAPVGGEASVRRTVLIPDTAARGSGRSVQLFAELEPQVYRWRLSAGGKTVSGKVRVRAAEVVEAIEPTTPEPVAPPAQPSKPPPSGPRGNQPIPPKPQP